MARPPQWTPENAGRFKDPTVASVYHLRLPYPPAIFDHLLSLVADPSQPLLDLGTGTGELARELAPHVIRIDAVDPSPAMLACALTMSGRNHPNIRWIQASAEEFASNDVYGLVTAGDSLHWMDWDVVLPQLSHRLVDGGFLAIVHRNDMAPLWQDELAALIARYSTARFYETFDLIAELERRGLFAVDGRFTTLPQESRQSIDDYIESFHSRSSLSRDNMPPAAADQFDQELRDLVTPQAIDGWITLSTVGEIVWGRPKGISSLDQD